MTTKLIIGLGNPGDRYKNTRHNAGFIALDRIAEWLPEKYDEWSSDWQLSKRSTYEYREFRKNDRRIILVRPLTYMNLSGKAAAQAKHDFSVTSNEDVLLVCDELDLLIGKAKVTKEKYSKTHNGVTSVLSTIGKGCTFLRLGIEAPTQRKIPGDAFVLMMLTQDEVIQLKKSIESKLSDVQDFILA
ncbi:MAG: aminoacyl-tRNA hydrolase [Candidatus Dojkabacteria bacterium]|nr:MAG: aminoacyl-tRNA hydrolase [Candidatus Dojkabacteria bacterium]